MRECVFAWETILAHLPDNAVVCRGILGTDVATTGNGQFAEEDFDEMLRRCGVGVALPGESDSDVLIVVQNDWDSDALDAAMAARKGGQLRVYSQEMVLACLMLGADLFEICSAEDLLAFADGHAGLEYFSTPGFRWPATEVSASSQQLVVDFAAGAWPETGVLKYMGHKVGRQGLRVAKRRETLHRTLEVELVAGSVGAAEYIKQWGAPRSQERLHKVANCLASFSRNHKRIVTADFSKAIADWESDLEYLRDTYYRPAMKFQWPNSEVP